MMDPAARRPPDAADGGGDPRIPAELAIETVFGCNLSCPMCSIDAPATRPKMVMPMDRFRFIADELAPHVRHVARVDLFGLGEPLLDRHLFERIAYLKERGFGNLAISTNAELLDADTRRALLESRIDTVIVSIDGARKETYEAIRRGAVFERVVAHTEAAIRLRDEGGFPTRFIVRFIRQAANAAEWEAFRSFWNARLSRGKRDFVAAYTMHNNGGLLGSKEDALRDTGLAPAVEAAPCRFPLECLIVLADGQVAACHPDFHAPRFNLGRIPPMTPLEAFNSEAFRALRAAHLDGRKNDVALCRECSIPYSQITREIGWDAAAPEPAAEKTHARVHHGRSELHRR